MAKRKRRGRGGNPKPSRTEVEKARRSEPSAEVSEFEFEASWTGPLPPPEILKGYDDIHAGLARELVESFKFEQRTARRRIDGSIVIGLATVGVAALAVWTGTPYAAIPFGFVGVISALVQRSLYGIRQGDQHRS